MFLAMATDGRPWIPRGMSIGSWRGAPLFAVRARLPFPSAASSTSSLWLPAPSRAPPITCTLPTGSSTSRILRGLSDVQIAKRSRTDDPERTKALEYFAGFLQRHCPNSSLAATMLDEGEDFNATSRSLLAALEPKKTGTLTKRAGSLRIYESLDHITL